MDSPIPVVALQPHLERVKQVPSVTEIPQSISAEETLSERSLLEELMEVDRLFITKRLSVRSTLLMQGKKNKFFVRTPNRKLIYTVKEQNRWWVGYLFYGFRPFKLSVLNGHGTEVMTINRPYSCTSRVLPCQLQTLEICSPPGQLIGSVEQQWTAVKPLYLVLNERNEPLFWVRGPCITVNFFSDVQFEIQRTDGTHSGVIFKRWQGLSHALCFATVTDRFGVTFERDLNVQEKALLMSVSLLLDYMYYDS